MKKIITGAIILLGIGISVFYYLKNDGTSSIRMFPTQAECEKETKKICDNTTMCDYKCPRGFHKGWWMPTTIPTTCAQAGERIGAQGAPSMCCEGLEAMGGYPGGYTGECSMPPPGGVFICSACGNTICDVGNLENKCNCPEDCK